MCAWQTRTRPNLKLAVTRMATSHKSSRWLHWAGCREVLRLNEKFNWTTNDTVTVHIQLIQVATVIELYLTRRLGPFKLTKFTSLQIAAHDSSISSCITWWSSTIIAHYVFVFSNDIYSIYIRMYNLVQETWCRFASTCFMRFYGILHIRSIRLPLWFDYIRIQLLLIR